MPLSLGQYQIGDLVFGNGTRITVTSCDVGDYGIVDSAFAMTQTDEIRFGRDYLQPGLISITGGVRDNWLINPGEGDIEPVRANVIAEELAEEWRADEIRLQWAYLKPLVYNRDNDVRRVYGRPRKFVKAVSTKKSQFIPVAMDYQRVDTYSYSDTEQSVTIAPSAAGTTTANIVRSGGRAPAWLRALITGPINDPILKVGSLFTVNIDFNLAATKVIEINAYPWERRVINSDGNNLNPFLVGPSAYLNEMRIPANATTGVGLSGSSTTGATAATVFWRETHFTF